MQHIVLIVVFLCVAEQASGAYKPICRPLPCPPPPCENPLPTIVIQNGQKCPGCPICPEHVPGCPHIRCIAPKCPKPLPGPIIYFQGNPCRGCPRCPYK